MELVFKLIYEIALLISPGMLLILLVIGLVSWAIYDWVSHPVAIAVSVIAFLSWVYAQAYKVFTNNIDESKSNASKAPYKIEK